MVNMSRPWGGYDGATVAQIRPQAVREGKEDEIMGNANTIATR